VKAKRLIPASPRRLGHRRAAPQRDRKKPCGKGASPERCWLPAQRDGARQPHSPRPPTTTQSFRPRGFPRTRNCSAIWYASSLPGRGELRRGRRPRRGLPRPVRPVRALPGPLRTWWASAPGRRCRRGPRRAPAARAARRPPSSRCPSWRSPGSRDLQGRQNARGR